MQEKEKPQLVMTGDKDEPMAYHCSVCVNSSSFPTTEVQKTQLRSFWRRFRSMSEKNMPKKRRGIEMRLLASKPSSFYSRFPGGTVGLALLVLRLVDGLGLAGEAIRLFIPAANSPEPTSVLLLGLVLVASAILLMLGLRTSLAGSAAAICTAGAAMHSKHSFNLSGSEMYAWSLLFALVFFLSGSLVLLGPGGYSLDARLSGWRMIRLSSGQSNANSQKGDQYVDR